MLVPLSWLKEYVTIDIPVAELAAKLTASGSSVERVYTIGEGLDDLIVAKAVAVAKHPNADRLKVAQVDTGSDVVEVVCGAPNLEAGQHVVFARPGARVPVNMHDEVRAPFVLEAATIRGVTSNGMICSAAEMGLGESHEGIVVLPDTTTIGRAIPEALGYPQTVLDIEVTTNRADELSMIGLAREVAILTDAKLTLPKSGVGSASGNSELTTAINSSTCYRLMAQKLRVKVGPSPWWMQQYLSLYGMRPINNVVDITNFVMLEYGQPLHGYDASRISGALVARQAKKDEVMTTLDGVERKLHESMLVIADESQAVGIAGIMGGEASRTETDTTEIILEAAVFDAVSIRKTANALALRSEASKRFERQVDATTTPIALQRAIDLLVEYAEAEVLTQAADSYPTAQSEKSFTLSQKKLNQYLGKELPLKEAAKILSRLGFEKLPNQVDDGLLAVSVPSWRARDVEGEEDLIEEVVRILGYTNLPAELPSGQLPNIVINREFESTQAIRQLLSQSGWWETLHNSLTTPAIEGQDGGVAIANPLSAEWTHMRQSLLPGLLATAKRNIRQRPEIKLYELSAVYIPQKDLSAGRQGLPKEQKNLGLVISSQLDIEVSLMQLKGVLNEIVSGLSFEVGDHRLGQPGNVASISHDGQVIGWLGQLEESTRLGHDLPEGTLVAELNIDDHLKASAPSMVVTLPTYPAVEEDLSLVVSSDVALGAVIESLQAIDLVERVGVTEIYRDSKLGAGNKSPLLHIVFRSSDHTLTADEVATARKKIVSLLNEKGITVRD